MQLFLYEQLNKQYRRIQNDKLALQGEGTMSFNCAVKQRVEYLFIFQKKILYFSNKKNFFILKL